MRISAVHWSWPTRARACHTPSQALSSQLSLNSVPSYWTPAALTMK